MIGRAFLVAMFFTFAALPGEVIRRFVRHINAYWGN